MDITKVYMGRAIPQEVRVSFSLAYSDWCELRASDLWHQLEQVVEGGERMDTSERLEKALIEFIERVSKGSITTAAEAEALPAVAMALIELIKGGERDA